MEECELNYKTCGHCKVAFDCEGGARPVCDKAGFWRNITGGDTCPNAPIDDMLRDDETTDREQADIVDTHGDNGEGWIGFDLDGTLAMYDGWKGIDHIGAPIGPMVSLIKKYRAQGRRVKILTARIAPHRLEDGTIGEAYITVPKGDGGATRQYARQYINDWCHFNLGFVPEIVYAKDQLMLELYDDRVKQVEPNTGIVIEDELNMLRSAIANKTLEGNT